MNAGPAGRAARAFWRASRPLGRARRMAGGSVDIGSSPGVARAAGGRASRARIDAYRRRRESRIPMTACLIDGNAVARKRRAEYPARVQQRVSLIGPVPGGVGPMTVTML